MILKDFDFFFFKEVFEDYICLHGEIFLGFCNFSFALRYFFLM